MQEEYQQQRRRRQNDRSRSRSRSASASASRHRHGEGGGNGNGNGNGGNEREPIGGGRSRARTGTVRSTRPGSRAGQGPGQGQGGPHRSRSGSRNRSRNGSHSQSQSRRSNKQSLEDVLRTSKRDVFSEETCSVSTGYAYQRSDEDQKAYLRSLEQSPNGPGENAGQQEQDQDQEQKHFHSPTSSQDDESDFDHEDEDENEYYNEDENEDEYYSDEYNDDNHHQSNSSHDKHHLNQHRRRHQSNQEFDDSDSDSDTGFDSNDGSHSDYYRDELENKHKTKHKSVNKHIDEHTRQEDEISINDAIEETEEEKAAKIWILRHQQEQLLLQELLEESVPPPPFTEQQQQQQEQQPETSNDNRDLDSSKSSMQEVDLEEGQDSPVDDPEQAALVGRGNKDDDNDDDNEHIYAVAICACCLLLFVLTGVIVLAVLGTRENGLTGTTGNSGTPSPTTLISITQLPTNVPTQSPTNATQAPTMAPTGVYYIDIPVWVEDFLPSETIFAIQSDPSSPQAKAFQFIQNDPYFNLQEGVQPTNTNTNNNNNTNINSTSTSASTNTNTNTNTNVDINAEILSLTPRELNQKRQTRFALATLFYAMGGPNWNTPMTMTMPNNDDQNATTAAITNANWLLPTDECDWPYFTCTATTTPTASITNADTANANNRAYHKRDYDYEHKSILERRNLQTTTGAVTRPNSNATTTSSPSSPGPTESYSSLQLVHVNASGTLPPEISILNNLQLLAIQTDDITFNETGNTTTLVHVNNISTHYGRLTGTLPSQMGLLTSLTTALLHDNLLSGAIPTEFGLLTNLQVLALHNNRLRTNSTVPAEVCHLTTVHKLSNISVDCEIVTCNCGCSCPTGGNATNDYQTTTIDESGNGNIFDHDGSNTNSSTAIPTNNTATGPATNASSPLTTTPATSLPATPVPTALMTTTQMPSPTGSTGNATTSAVVSAMEVLEPSNASSDALLCNGLANICDFRLNDILFPMLHNSMADIESGFLVGNHFKPLEQAVENGYRGVNLDLCNCGGSLVFCHRACALGSRDPEEVLSNLHLFLQNNPNEVLVLTIQITSEADQPVDVLEFYSILEGIDGLIDLIYMHEVSEAPWPTLRELIESNQRVVLFHFNGPNCKEDGIECPPGLHYYFDYAAETEFEFNSVAELSNASQSCKITRGGNAPHLAFFGINNFLKLPNAGSAAGMNSMDFLDDRVTSCLDANEHGLNASFLYIDFWTVGDTLEYAKDYNRKLGWNNA